MKQLNITADKINAAGPIEAQKFIGKATKDGNGNDIVTTYETKSDANTAKNRIAKLENERLVRGAVAEVGGLIVDGVSFTKSHILQLLQLITAVELFDTYIMVTENSTSSTYCITGIPRQSTWQNLIDSGNTTAAKDEDMGATTMLLSISSDGGVLLNGSHLRTKENAYVQASDLIKQSSIDNPEYAFSAPFFTTYLKYNGDTYSVEVPTGSTWAGCISYYEDNG